MAWSTRELADLAGTTVKTVRHYHRLGLLEEPERRSNGYKQYQVRHLVSLLRIRRLVELGVPLSNIGDVRSGGGGTPEVLHELDAELAASIERQQKARADIAAILRDSAPADTPMGFESVSARLSEADRSLIHVYGRLYDQEAMSDVRQMVEAETDAVSAEFDALPPDAGEETRQRLVEQMAPKIMRDLTDYPWLASPEGHLSKSETFAQQTFLEAVVELYNAAQLDVLGRASQVALKKMGSGAEQPSADDGT